MLFGAGRNQIARTSEQSGCGQGCNLELLGDALHPNGRYPRTPRMIGDREVACAGAEF